MSEPIVPYGAPNLHDQLVAIKAEIANHESDLQVKLTLEALALVQASKYKYSVFTSSIDGSSWIEVPFAYTPWWVKRAASSSEWESK